MTYSIYGLRVRSDLPLPAVSVPEDGETDLTVSRGGRIPRPDARASPEALIDWRQTKEGWLLCYHTRPGELLEFAFDPAGSRIEIRCTLPGMKEDIAALLVGAGLAAALNLRGAPILHASAVVVDGKAVLVAGPTGTGKSTLTAALVGRGASLLADDLAVLAFGRHAVMVQPGYPRLRLCPDATFLVGKTAPELPSVFDALVEKDKRWVDATTLPGGFRAVPAPLGAVYLLAPRDLAPRDHDRPAAEFVPLSPHRAGLAMPFYFYGSRWLRIPPAKAVEWCARIAGRTPVRILHVPPGLERVTETADALLGDARRSTAPGKPIAPAALA